MENLFGTIGRKDPRYLLASNYDADAIAVSVEPGHGTIPAGAVLYRKTGVLYAPCASANIVTTNNLVVLRDDVDTTTSDSVAVAVAAYRRATFIAGKVLVYDGVSAYEPITDAHAIVLRKQGLELSPMDDLSAASPTEADNQVTVSVTMQNDGHGSASASPASGKKGTEVTLTATPASDYAFDYWEVVSGDAEINASNKFVIGDKAPTIKAHFKASA